MVYRVVVPRSPHHVKSPVGVTIAKRPHVARNEPKLEVRALRRVPCGRATCVRRPYCAARVRVASRQSTST